MNRCSIYYEPVFLFCGILIFDDTRERMNRRNCFEVNIELSNYFRPSLVMSLVMSSDVAGDVFGGVFLCCTFTH